MNSLYDADKKKQIGRYDSIREDVHIHAPYLVIREHLLDIKKNPQWLSKNFQQYRTEKNALFFNLQLPWHNTKAVLDVDQSEPFLVTYKNRKSLDNEPMILSITWALHVETTNDAHLTVELFYRPSDGILGNLKELIILKGARIQAFRESLWNLKQLIENQMDNVRAKNA